MQKQKILVTTSSTISSCYITS